MSGRISIWVGYIFLECFSNISQRVLLSLKNIIINCKKAVFLKNSPPPYVVSVCCLESYSSLSFTAVNAGQKWTLCLFLFFNKKNLFKVCILWRFLSLFDCKCYIHLVGKRNHFHLTYSANKHLGIQLQFCKARLNVQIITCANDYPWSCLSLPRKVDREYSASLWLYPIGQNNSAGEKGEIYGWHRLLHSWSSCSPVPSLLHGQCNDVQKFIWKISYVCKLWINHNPNWMNEQVNSDVFMSTNREFGAFEGKNGITDVRLEINI